MEYTTIFRFSSLLSFFVLFIVAAAADGDYKTDVRIPEICEYTLKVKTGTFDSAGTDAVITVVLSDEIGRETLRIKDLQEWGMMGSGHNYFENGDLDIFVLGGGCFPTPLCSIVVTSDNSGAKPGWYLEYIEVTTTGDNTPVGGQKILFEFNQWLAVDSPPYSLTASRDQCRN